MFTKVKSDEDFAQMEREILKDWDRLDVFGESLRRNAAGGKFVFYEGPPTANGRPHPGHVLTRAMKDVFLRYQTMQGKLVNRKGGWDTHGLAVELEVERELGISGKPEIERFGVEEFIDRCKASVWRYEQEWRRMTERVGFWLDMEHAYVTYADDYIESVWWALRQIWDKGLLYHGHKVVPYCPRCGTALSSHEVAQGYDEVEDPSIFVRFRVKRLVPQAGCPGHVDDGGGAADSRIADTSFLVWTTTPWTLPSNVALAVGPEFRYVEVEPVAAGAGGRPERLILAADLADQVLGSDGYRVVREFRGRELEGSAYEPLFPFARPDRPAWRVECADFVVLSEGTGIVHIAPAFGDDDMKLAGERDLPVVQLVDVQGRFTGEVEPWKGMFVKDADPLIIDKLREEGKLFRSGKHLHSYPFCWRCDTPLLYYARSSWFIKVTAMRDRLLANNRAVRWVPEHIRDGRFGDFLENVVDWAVSRERYWGTPLPIWICQACGRHHCVGSVSELKAMARKLPERLELHRPYIDRAVLACPECGGDMHRTLEVIDAWFDSGSMPFAQWHYPFENKEAFENNFPADFITEAIDQTRGWFYTLMVISTLLFDLPPYRSVLVLGHVLDQEGQKMSKSRGNVVDVWQVFDNQGADAMRWYLYTVNPPWSPTRFYMDAVSEARWKFLGTLWNVYAFYVLYANIDRFDPSGFDLPAARRAAVDRWILSRLAGLVERVTVLMDQLDVTGAARAMEEFVDDLSNWYVRRSRRRYWGPAMTEDKVAAYLTLHECLVTVATLAAPFVPFTSEHIFRNLTGAAGGGAPPSVHLAPYPALDRSLVDRPLEEAMRFARQVVYLGRAARNRVNIKNRQPLSRLVAAVQGGDAPACGVALDGGLLDLIKDELNVKAIEFASDPGEFVTYRLKPRFDLLGPKHGRLMPAIARALSGLAGAEARVLAMRLQSGTPVVLDLGVPPADAVGAGAGARIEVLPEEVTVETVEAEGWCVESNGGLTVALCTRLTEDLLDEGFARETVNKIQSMRKEAGFEIEDRILTRYWCGQRLARALERHREYLMDETLSAQFTREGDAGDAPPVGGTIRRWDVNGEPAVVSVCVKAKF